MINSVLSRTCNLQIKNVVKEELIRVENKEKDPGHGNNPTISDNIL